MFPIWVISPYYIHFRNGEPKNYTGGFFSQNLIKLHKFAFCFFPCVFSAIFSLFIVNMNLPLKQEMYEWCPFHFNVLYVFLGTHNKYQSWCSSTSCLTDKIKLIKIHLENEMGMCVWCLVCLYTGWPGILVAIYFDESRRHLLKFRWIPHHC